MSAHPVIAIVVVSFNHKELTLRCLTSLRKVRYPHRTVILVDNGSSDDTAGTVASEFPEVVLLAQDQNRGFTGGNNVGIDWALRNGADAVLLLNNDAIAHPEILDWMLPHLDERTIVVPESRSIRDETRITSHVGSFDWRLGVARTPLHGTKATDGRGPSSPSVAGGACLLIPRHAFEACGVFDEEFFLYYEDSDLLTRMQDRGFRLVYEPRAVILHDEGSSSGSRSQNPISVYYCTRNRLYFMHKHRRRTNFPFFLLYFLATRLIYLAKYCLSGNLSLARSVVLGVMDFFRGRMRRASLTW